MEDPSSKEIDALLVPGMMNLNVVEALSKASNLCSEMKESSGLCLRLLDRLLFLRDELSNNSSELMLTAEEHSKLTTQLAHAVGLVVSFFKKYAEKRPLQRIAASRAIREEVPILHAKIDTVFNLADLSGTPEMIAWKQQHESDISAQRRQFEVLVRDRGAVSRDLSGSSLDEALMELKYEIDSGKNPRGFTELLENVLQAMVQMVEDATIPEVPPYYVRRDDVKIGEQIDMGSFGEVHKAKWGIGEAEVVAKMLYMDGEETKRQFLRESKLWYRLSHPNVNKMLGGCPVGKPLFFIAEYAKQGNLADVLDKTENRNKLWRLFFQAAQGLSYLHSENIIHCDIKCNNILVGDDGAAKLCDFGFSHIRKLSIGKSIKEQPSSARWKAPECLLEQGPGANPTFKSDVYALAMSIIEAKIGGVPWGMMSDEAIINEVASGNGYCRPEGDLFSDKEWHLIRCMTALEPTERMSLPEAMETLAELAKEEAASNTPLQTVLCGNCNVANPSDKKYCGDCGGPIEKSRKLQKLSN